MCYLLIMLVLTNTQKKEKSVSWRADHVGCWLYGYRSPLISCNRADALMTRYCGIYITSRGYPPLAGSLLKKGWIWPPTNRSLRSLIPAFPLNTNIFSMYSTITSKRLNFVSHHTHTQTGAIWPSLALLAHSALSKDTACAEALALSIDTLALPPCGRSGRHLVARQPWPILTIHQNIGQNRPQTAEI